jgi:hypothetical protein
MKEIRQPELWLARIDFMDGRIAQRAPGAAIGGRGR